MLHFIRLFQFNFQVISFFKINYEALQKKWLPLALQLKHFCIVNIVLLFCKWLLAEVEEDESFLLRNTTLRLVSCFLRVRSMKDAENAVGSPGKVFMLEGYLQWNWTWKLKAIKRPCVLVQSVLSKLVTVILLTVKNGRGLLKVFVLKRDLTVLQKLWSVWCYVMVSTSSSGRLLDGVCIFKNNTSIPCLWLLKAINI